MMRWTKLAWVCLLGGLTGCASEPPTPAWQMESRGALDRYVAAAMSGHTRVESAEFDRARKELTATGRAELVARAELTRCAIRLASLIVEPCAGFEPLRPDAGAAERAYADYLAGQLRPADAALLPAQHQPVASGQANAATLKAIADPLSRLVASGVLFQAGRADPEVMALAVDTASAQGWRRPLLAWLGVQLKRAEAAGATEEAERLRRRLALVSGQS